MTTAPTGPVHEHEVLTEDEFYERYDPIAGPDGSDIWEYDHVKNRPTKHVWSVVEDEHGNLVAIPGWHVVNVIGYSVTGQPWEHTNIDARYHSIPLDD